MEVKIKTFVELEWLNKLKQTFTPWKEIKKDEKKILRATGLEPPKHCWAILPRHSGKLGHRIDLRSG